MSDPDYIKNYGTGWGLGALSTRLTKAGVDEESGGFQKMKQGDNTRKNKDFDWVVKELGLSKKEARRLHNEITKQGMDKYEILEHAKNMFPEKKP